MTLKEISQALFISKATSNEAQEIITFLNRVGGETDFLTFGLNEFPLTIQNEIEIISECNEPHQSLMLLGKIRNEIVSQLFLERSRSQRINHIGTIGITVSKTHWRKSIGKKMLLTAIEWAKLNGITKLQLAVRTDHFAAISLYEKLGFSIEGTLTRAVKINEEYFDNYLMGLEINPPNEVLKSIIPP